MRNRRAVIRLAGAVLCGLIVQPASAQAVRWPAGKIVPRYRTAFRELQVIDHWNLRYHKEYDDFSLGEQIAQIKCNMDVASELGFTSYLLFQEDAFPELLTWGGKHEPDDDLRRAVREVLDHATKRGLKLYLHCNEFMWPDEVGVPYGDTPAAWETYRRAIEELTALYPDLAGFEVTADETSGALETREGVLKFHNETARALRADGRERTALMRTWQRVEVLGSPTTLGKTDYQNVIFSVKNTDGDFGCVKGFDEGFLEAAGDPTRLLVEFDAWREYETHNIFPIYLADYWTPRFRRLAEIGIERLGLRFNWNSGRFPITERPWANWVNVFAFVRLAENPYADPDAILREFVGLYYPAEAHRTAFDLYKSSFDYVKDLYWVGGEPIGDHGRVNREGKLGGKEVPADWMDRVDASLRRMLAIIDALPQDGAYKEELRHGALVVSYLSRACALQMGAEGDAAFLAEWKRTDPESFEELRGSLAVELLAARGTREPGLPAESTTDSPPVEGDVFEAEKADVSGALITDERTDGPDDYDEGATGGAYVAFQEDSGEAITRELAPRSARTVVRAGTTLEVYPVSPLFRGDGIVGGTANGAPIPFESFRTSPEYYYDVSYAWLAADGPLDVELRVQAWIERAHLRTVLEDLPFEKSGSSLAFRLPGPGHYYLQLPDLGRPEPGNPHSGTYTVAFWIDDLEVVRAKRAGLKDATYVTESGVVSDGDADQTAKIQAALERGGTIVFPAGVYRASRLRIPSDTTVYLAPGAAIQAVGSGVGKSSPFLDLSGSENVRIHGPGTIDGNDEPYHLVQTESSHSILLEDFLVRNCTSWAIHLLLVDHVVCRNIRVLSGKDGIDPDCAKDVTIENVFIMSKDDAVAVKTRKPSHSTERVVVRDSIVASDASALKVGTETRALMRDITFERCDVFDSDRGIILYARDGGPIENATWRDIRLFVIDWPHETGGAPMQFEITERAGATPVRHCTVESIWANALVPCTFEGLRDAPLDGLRLRNVTLRASRPRNAGRHLLEVGSSVAAEIDGLTVQWDGNRSLWAGVLSGSGLRVRDLKESEVETPATGESIRGLSEDSCARWH